MSIDFMTWVWKTSPAKGVELLIELACADYANDEGYFWSSVKSIAQKSRCTDRYVRDYFKRISGVRIEPLDEISAYGTRVYQFKRELSSPPELSSPLKSATAERNCATQNMLPSSANPLPNPSPNPSSPDQKAASRKEKIEEAVGALREKLNSFQEKFPHVDAASELEGASYFLLSTKKNYTDYAMFFSGWLKREEDKKREQLERAARQGNQAPNSRGVRSARGVSQRGAPASTRDRAGEARRALGRS